MSGFFDNFRRLLGWWNSVQPPAVIYTVDASQEITAQQRRTAFTAQDLRQTGHDSRRRRTSFTPPKARQ